MKSRFFLILCLLTPFLLKAQNALVEGVITQKGTEVTLPGVSVYLENTKLGAATNGKGNYFIKEVPPGQYTLVVSCIGYNTQKIAITVNAKETTKQDIGLTENVLDLPEMVVQSVTMTGGLAGLKEIPGSAFYISPKEIAKFSYTDINRMLRSVPGINLQEEDGFGLRPNIGLRGTGVERSSKITIMEDGVLMAPAPYASPAAYYFPTIGRMQAVEILKGSSQIKYGPFTTGGAINLISTQIPANFSGKIHLIGGSFGGRNLHANIGNSHKNFGYMVETFMYGSDGFKKLDGGGDTGFDKKDYIIKFRVNTNPDAKIYQSLNFKVGQTVEESNETYLGLTEDDYSVNPLRRYSASQKDVINTKQTQLSVTHLIHPAKFLDITTTAYRTDFHRNWYKLDAVKDTAGTKFSIADVLENPQENSYAYSIISGTSSINDDALYVKANNRTYYSQGIQTILGFNFKTAAITHKIDAGFRYHYDEMDRFQHQDEYRMENSVMQLTKSGIAGTESNQVVSATAMAAYVQYKLNWNKLSVVPGIRFENVQLNKKDYGKTDTERTGASLIETKNTVSSFIPGIGIDYKFSKNLSAFAGVHKGFAPPGPTEDAKPEESYNYELGLRYVYKGLSGQVVGFYNNYKNLLGSDLAASGGSGTGELFNGGRAESKGVEFQTTYDFLSSAKTAFSLPLTIVYSYTDAIFKSSFKSDFEDWGTVIDGDHLPYLANNQFNFILALEHKLFSINVSGKYTDVMRTKAGQGNIPEHERTDAFFTLDASANYAVHKNISLFGNVTNITNEVYVVARRPSGLRPGMPRAFNLGVKANF